MGPPLGTPLLSVSDPVFRFIVGLWFVPSVRLLQQERQSWFRIGAKGSTRELIPVRPL